ncbi:SUMO ligase siz1 [Serendipita sp. 400]|nr:SUMO ligase siz1 [Serendipita sp. 400]
MATTNAWGDFDRVVAELRNLTVVYLKSVIHGLSDENVDNLIRTGKKAELQDRILRALQRLQSQGQVDKWMKARAVILQAVSGIEYDSATLSRFMNTGQPEAGSSVNANPPMRQNRGFGVQPPTPSFGMPPGRAPVHNLGPSRPGVYAPSVPIWRPSPFYRIDTAVSSVTECPESTSSSDRRTARFNFYLNHEQWRKLHEDRAKYQLRLYCTTSQYYIPTSTAFRNTPCPIEFPPTCEVRINNQVLSANFRGIKKKAGTAPPADITQLVRPASGQGNQVEMIYVNSSQPNSNKPPTIQKYYLVVNLVEVTSVKELVNRLRSRIQSRDTVLEKIKSQQSGDDEVQMGPTRLSLRDPLTYTRLKLPCRASTCVHIGCFDASCWYSMMEQTTTWLCPICDRTLDVAELVIDEYVSNILENVPEDIDDVMVEADGEWHTEDRKYGSQNWMRTFGVPIDANSIEEKLEEHPQPSKPLDPSIEIGDSDFDSDSEEEQVKQEIESTATSMNRRSQPSSSLSTTPLAPPVIDLTLSDSEEEGQLPARPPLPSMPISSLGKRKLSSDGELAGSSRRTSTAASHRSARLEDDDNVSHPLPPRPNIYPPSPYGPPRSPTTPFGTYHSPTLYKPNGAALPSPTARSPPSLPHTSQWTQPIDNYRGNYALPPASSLILGPPITNTPLNPHASSHLPRPPQLTSQYPRPPTDNDRPQPMHRSSNSGSSASRYAEWGLGSSSFT